VQKTQTPEHAVLILAFLLRAILNPTEVIALHFAECDFLARPMDDSTVAVKWVCPN
jgi:hypothetical protein